MHPFLKKFRLSNKKIHKGYKMKFTDKKESSSCGCNEEEKSTNICPNCNSKGTKVTGVTIKAQLKKELYENLSNSSDDFNFCNTPKCDTVYYANDESEVYTQDDIKTKVALKNEDPQTPLCYCRRLLKQNVIDMINNKEENIAQKVFDIVSSGKSVCERVNPRGVCCTEDITRFLADYGIDYQETNSCENSTCGTSDSTTKSSCC